MVQNDFNEAMVHAAKEGYIDIVHLMIDHGADSFNVAMVWSRKVGHVDIANLMTMLHMNK